MGGRSGQSISGGFVFSHSFINDRGNRVDQYSIYGGGYARVEKWKDGFEMTNVIIHQENRGKGYATKLYQKVNKESVKSTGNTLQSVKRNPDGSLEFSADGVALWKSFVRKGMAEDIGDGRFRFKK